MLKSCFNQKRSNQLVAAILRAALSFGRGLRSPDERSIQATFAFKL